MHIKMKHFLPLFAAAFLSLGGCGGSGGGGGGGGTITPTPPPNAVTITNSGNYFDVVIDYASRKTPDAIGREYGEKLLRLLPNFEALGDSYLGELIGSASLYQICLQRLAAIRPQIDAEYRSEIEGFAKGAGLTSTNTMNDGKLSVDELYLMNLVTDIIRPSACSAVGVWGTRSETTRTLVARNLEWYPGKDEQAARLHAITTIRNGTKSLALVGFVGSFGALTAFNSRGVFAAVLDSETGAAYASANRRSYVFDLRKALESATATDNVADYMKNTSRLYTFNHNIFLADINSCKILENNFSDAMGKLVSRQVRTASSELTPGFHPGIVWGIDNSIGCVNSFVLKGNTDNHTVFINNTARWNSMTTQLRSKGGSVSVSDLQEIIGYTSGSTPGTQAQGDLYTNLTLQMVLFRPDTQQLSVFFRRPTGTPLPPVPAFENVFVMFQ